jgi:hypothetical protein
VKYLIVLLLAIAPLLAKTQGQKMLNIENYDKKRLHFGFTLSVNSMDYRLHLSDKILTQTDSVYGVETVRKPGFGVGMLTDLKLNEYFNLRFQPGLQIGQRNLRYKMRDLGQQPQIVFLSDYEMKIPVLYVDFPLLVKFRAKRINNYRPYLIGGGSAKFDYETRRENQKNKDYSVRAVPLQFFYEFGFGIDYYMPFFKLSTEIKFARGFHGIIVQENTDYTSAIAKMLPRMFVFSLHFE